jgi:Fe-S-cluster-containing dehydrogenase component
MEIVKECQKCQKAMYAGEGKKCVLQGCENSLILNPLTETEKENIKELKALLYEVTELQKQQPENENLAIQLKNIQSELEKITRPEMLRKSD